MGGPVYQAPQLQQLWIDAGGDPAKAPMAAAIALAESGGNPGVVSRTNDYGLWQINRSAHPGQATLDPLGNARAAVAISANGTAWQPWCTAWSDGACGTAGGTYMGAGAPYQQHLRGSAGSSIADQIAGAGFVTTPIAPSVEKADKNPVLFKIPIPIPGVPDITIYQSQGRAMVGGLALVGGALVLLVGLVVIAGGTAGSAIPKVREWLPQSKTEAQKARERNDDEEIAYARASEEADNQVRRSMRADELAERRRVKVARREGLVRPA